MIIINQAEDGERNVKTKQNNNQKNHTHTILKMKKQTKTGWQGPKKKKSVEKQKQETTQKFWVEGSGFVDTRLLTTDIFLENSVIKENKHWQNFQNIC